jgi:hypothetical protein
MGGWGSETGWGGRGETAQIMYAQMNKQILKIQK